MVMPPSGLGVGLEAGRQIVRLGREPSTWWLLLGVVCFIPVVGPVLAFAVLVVVVAADLYRNRIGRPRSWVKKAWLIGFAVPILYAVLLGGSMVAGVRWYVDGEWQQRAEQQRAELARERAAVPADIPVDEPILERWRFREEKIERDLQEEVISRMSTVISVGALLGLLLGFGAYRGMRSAFLY